MSKPDLENAVREKLSVLRDKSHAELASLPGCDTEDIHIEGLPAQRSIYSEALEAGDLRVVVQVGTVTGGNFGQRYAEGFVVAPDGQQREIKAPEIYEFM